MPRSNFRCDQIYRCRIYDFGHTLLYYLSQTKVFNKPTLKPVCFKSSCLAQTLGVTKCRFWSHYLSYLSLTWIFNKPTSANKTVQIRHLCIKITISTFHRCLIFMGIDHRHLRNIYYLVAQTACLVCFISTVNGWSKGKR
jgi:hypothetical protein